MRPSTTLLSTLVALCTHAFAQDLASIPVWGTFSPADLASTTGQEAAAAAGRHPNLTNAVVFQSPVGDTNETFTWRVNITSLAVPNDIQNFGKPSATLNYSKNYHVANTQWQLEWPSSSGAGSQSLQSFLSQNNQSIMFIEAGINYAPSSMTENWTNPSDGDCSSVLTAECVEELQQLPPKIKSNNQTDGISSKCTKIVNSAMGSGFLTAYLVEPSQPSTAFYSNDTIFYTTTTAYNSSNSSAYEYAKSTLQMLTIYYQDHQGDWSDASVVCQILCKDCPHMPSSTSAAATLPAKLSKAFGVVVAVVILLVAL